MSEEPKSAEHEEQGGARGHDTEAKEKEKTKVTSAVPERVEGVLNPSSPGNTGTTPGTNAKAG